VRYWHNGPFVHNILAGIFLSFTGHFVLVQISNGAWMGVAESFGGVALMTALAYLSRGISGSTGVWPRPPRPQPAVRSGDRG
jgi:hypothetical protein